MFRISQKDAVYEASIKVLKENAIDFEEGIDVLQDVLDKDMRESIVCILVESFNQDKIVQNKTHKGDDLKRYVSGLISNWSKKDTRLNGNTEYTIKKPGSKTGSTDPMVRELRKFLKQVRGTSHEKTVKKELTNRISQIRIEQSKNIIIDPNLIPESLRHLIQN